MSTGLGNIVVNSKKETGGGGGTVTGADNGLTLVGTDIYLGGNLIQVTDVDVQGFDFSISNAGSKILFLQSGLYQFGDIGNDFTGLQTTIDANNNNYTVGDGLSPYLLIDVLNKEFNIGDISGNQNGTYLGIDDTAQLVQVYNNTNRYLVIDTDNGIYQIGDIDNVLGNNTFLDINANVGAISALLFDGTGPTSQFGLNKNGFGGFNGGDGLGNQYNAEVFSNRARLMYTQSLNGASEIANLSDGTNPFARITSYDETNLNATTFSVERDVITANANIGGVNGDMLKLDAANLIFQMGDIDLAGNGSFFAINDTGEVFRMAGAGDYLLLNGGSGTYQMGDISGVGNQSFFDINDSTQNITQQCGDSTFTGQITQASVNPNQFYVYSQEDAVQFVDFRISATNEEISITAVNGLKITGDAAFLLHTGQAMTNGAAAAVGTLNNAPTAGNPTKWIAIDDNGVTRYFPTWEPV